MPGAQQQPAQACTVRFAAQRTTLLYYKVAHLWLDPCMPQLTRVPCGVLQPVCFRENDKPVSKDVEKAVAKSAAKGK